MIRHEFRPDTNGKCVFPIHIRFEEGPMEAIDAKTGEKRIITDDRSIYVFCGKPKSEHAA